MTNWLAEEFVLLKCPGDDIVICKETRKEVEWRLECWRYALERGMNISRSKTEFLCINEGNDKETVKMEKTKVPKVKKFKYLRSTMQESGSCEREVKRRVQAGWNGWRKVSRVICDRRLPAIYSKRKSVQFSGEISNGVWT